MIGSADARACPGRRRFASPGPRGAPGSSRSSAASFIRTAGSMTPASLSSTRSTPPSMAPRSAPAPPSCPPAAKPLAGPPGSATARPSPPAPSSIPPARGSDRCSRTFPKPARSVRRGWSRAATSSCRAGSSATTLTSSRTTTSGSSSRSLTKASSPSSAPPRSRSRATPPTRRSTRTKPTISAPASTVISRNRSAPPTSSPVIPESVRCSTTGTTVRRR